MKKQMTQSEIEAHEKAKRERELNTGAHQPRPKDA